MSVSLNLQSNYITSPAQIPGLQMWLDANDTSTIFQDSNGLVPASNGSPVILWRDKTINSNHFYNAPAAVNSSNPTLVSGQGVFFLPRNLSNCDIMASSNPVAFSSAVTSIFLVIATSTNGQWLTLGTNTTDFSLRQNFGFNNGDVFNNRPTYVNGLLSASFVTMAGNSNYFILDGVVNTNSTSNYSTRIQFNTTFLNRGSRMFIQSLLIYSNVLTLTQRQQIQGWLAWNYNINNNLTTGHPYRFSSNNPGYAVDFQQISQSRINALTIAPTDVPGLALWLDGADRTTFTLSNTSNITQWTDKIGSNSFTLLGTSNPTLTSNVQNGLSAVTFNGTSQTLRNTTFVFPNNAFTIFSLQYLASTVGNGSGFQRVATATNNDLTFFVGANTGLVAVFTGPGVTSWNDINALVPSYNNVSNWALVASYSAPAGTSNILANFINGFNYNVKTGTTGAFTGLMVGGFGVGAQFWNGYVAEFLVYNRVLSDPERQRVESYLSWKWGLNNSLPIVHPYYFNTFLPNVPTQITTSLNTFVPSRWQPNSFANLAVWFDASDTSVQRTGNVVTQWNDKSGLNIIATASNAPTIASNFLNNLNVIQLNSNTQQFFSAGSNTMNITTQDFAIFALVNILNTQTTAIVSKGYTGAGTDIGHWLLTNVFQYRNGINSASPAITLTSNNWFIISGMGYRTGQITPAFLNGSLANSWPFTFNAQTITNSSNFFIGRSEAGTFYNGYIAEIIGYSNTITATQRQQIEGYLAWKWGLSGNLVYGHPNQYMPPN